MRILFLLAALLLLGTFAWPSMQEERPPPPVTLVSFTPVPLYEKAPGARRLGELFFLGGWSLASNDYRFGGFSAARVENGEIIALSDSGGAFRFSLLSGPVVRSEVAVVKSRAEGRGKAGRDVESLVVLGRQAWLGFEQENEIRRYALPEWQLESSAAPKAMAKWDENRGPEAMVRLPDGRFLVFSEGSGGESDVVMFEGDPAVAGTPARHLRYRPPDGYRITDAALLPDGRLLFLNRRFRLFEGFSARLSISRLATLEEGSVITGEVVADFVRPVTTDNLEALSVTQEGGRTIVWIASDDNYNSLQRSLLLKFALVERAPLRRRRLRPASW